MVERVNEASEHGRFAKALFGVGTGLMVVGLPLGNITIGLLLAALGLAFDWEGRAFFRGLMAWTPFRWRWRLSHVLWTGVVTVVISGALSPRPLQAIAAGLAYLLYIWLGFFVGSGIFSFVRRTPDAARWVGGIGVGITLIMGLRATWMYLIGDPGRRVLTLLLPPNESGSMWMLAIVLSAVYSIAVGVRPWVWFGRSGVLTGIAGLSLTMSRGSLIGTAVMGLFAVLRPKTLRLLLLVAIAALLALSLSTSLVTSSVEDLLNHPSNIDRVLAWRVAPAMIADHPIVGIGVGEYSRVYPEYRLPETEKDLTHAHNYIVHVLVELGIVGSFPLLLVLFLVGTYALRLWAQGTGAARVLGIGWMGLLAREQFDVTNLSADVATGFWIVGALVLLLQLDQARHTPNSAGN